MIFAGKKVDKMKMTNTEYGKLAEKRSPNSKLLKNMSFAFLIGGLICCIGQCFINIYTFLGMTKTEAGLLTSMTMVFISAILTGLGLYDKIAKYGGAGTLVPITGFANAVVSPALEFKTEGYVLGVGAKLFVIAGPVIVYGLTASVVYGIILYLIRLA